MHATVLARLYNNVLDHMQKCKTSNMDTQEARDIRQKNTQEHKRQRTEERSRVQTVQNVSNLFSSAVKEGPDYVCTCCHRLMYRKTVVEFKY